MKLLIGNINYNITDSDMCRFWDKVDKNGQNGCWVWGRSTRSSGVGNFAINKAAPSASVPADKFSFVLCGGKIKDGYEIQHVCGNMLCVNPEHMKYLKIKRKIKKVRNRKIVSFAEDEFLQKISSSRLTPLEKYKGQREFIKFRCICGNEVYVRPESIFTGHIKSCGCYRKRHFVGDISMNRWHRVVGDAKKRNIEITITPEQAWDLFLKQNKKCALTGRDIYFSSLSRGGYQTASLDRIDRSIGYHMGNVQWLHRDINLAKHIKTDDEFIGICREVVNYADKRGLK